MVPAAALALPPVNLTPPEISGGAQEGQQLACSQGTWLFTPTSYAYQWNRDGSAIGGATASSYTVQSADVIRLVTCSVVASNADGPSLLPATSLPVVPTASPGGTPPSGGTTPPASGAPQAPVPGTAFDHTAPVVMGFSLARKRFAVGRPGTKIRFRLSERAGVELAISRSVRGRRSAIRRAGRLVRVGLMGKNSVVFRGRIGRRALKPGRYVVTITARDAVGNVSTPRKARFRVVRKKRRPR